MKLRKSILALLLACCTLFPACSMGGGETSGNGSSSTSVESASTGGNDYAGEHVDDNNDGVCDDCSESVVVKFDIFAINDLHGKFLDTSSQPGVDEMSTYIKNARAKNPNTILLSSGDMWQGSPESNLTKGAIVTEWMNEMDFASMTLGNHEYDWGEKAIEDNSKIAEFPFLGINVYDTETNKIVDYCKPSVVVEKNGVKIGIIGAEGNVHSSISTDRGKGVEFKTGTQLGYLVKAESKRLRAEGVDCIIYSIHDGETDDYEHYDETLSKDGYVDIVFEAHTHDTYVKKDDFGVYHVQGGGDNYSGIAHAEINVNYVTSTAKVAKTPEQIRHTAYTSLTDDPTVKTLETKYAAQIAPAYEVLGYNSAVKGEDEMLSVSALTYYQAGAAKWADKPIVFGGGFMNVRAPYQLKVGTITYGDIINLMPFDNELVLCTVKGSSFLNNFINNEKYYLAYSAYGQSLKENQSQIDMNADYYVVVDRYTSTYKANRMTEIEWYDTTTFQRDLYAEYLKKNLAPVPETSTPETSTVEQISVKKALEIGGNLEAGATTAKSYRVQGEIIDVEPLNTYYNKQFGNMTIKDGEGNTLYIYGSCDTDGTEYEKMENPPKVGDYVVLEGALQRYVKTDGSVDKVELINGKIISFEKVATIPEITAIGDGLSDNEKTTEEYAVWGTIQSITSPDNYGNMVIVDENNATLYIYGTLDMSGKKYGAMTDKPQVGDKVLITGKVVKYVKETGATPKIEMENGVIREVI